MTTEREHFVTDNVKPAPGPGPTWGRFANFRFWLESHLSFPAAIGLSIGPGYGDLCVVCCRTIGVMFLAPLGKCRRVPDHRPGTRPSRLEPLLAAAHSCITASENEIAAGYSQIGNLFRRCGKRGRAGAKQDSGRNDVSFHDKNSVVLRMN